MKKILIVVITLLLFTANCITIPGGCSLPALPSAVSSPPTAYIDSITPPGAAPGEKITFNGHGTDPDGTVVAYRWRSSISGDLSSEAKFDTKLDPGDHIIYFKVQDNNGNWSNEVRSSVNIIGSGPPPPSSPPASLPVINSFTSMPATITPGASSNLNWNVSGATTVSIDQGIGNVGAVGNTSVTPGSTRSYTLTATNAAGTLTATTQVVVGAVLPSGLPVINSFSASPPSIFVGGSSTLNWNVSGATSVTLDPGVGGVGSVGSKVVSPGSTTSYTLTASNSAGWFSQTIVVTVNQFFVPKFPLLPLSLTVTLNPVPAETGSVYSAVHSPVTNTLVGDASDNTGIRTYFSYNISSLAGKNIVSAKLTFATNNVVGNPFTELTGLWIGTVNYGEGALQSSDYNLSSVPIGSLLNSPPTTIDVTSQVQSAVSASKTRFQIRGHFSKVPSNMDNAADYIMFSNTNTTLTIIYN